MKSVKKAVLYLLCVMLVVMLSACKNTHPAQDTALQAEQPVLKDRRVTDAIELVAKSWSKNYKENGIKDKYLEIVNTTIINVKDNGIDNFKNVDYVVEFDLKTNFYDSAPYYCAVPRDRFVIVDKSGNSELAGVSPFEAYMRSHGPDALADIIQSVEDFHGKYDQIIELN